MATLCINWRQLILIDSSSLRQSSFLRLHWHQLTSTDINWTWRVKYDVKLRLIWRSSDANWLFNWRQIKCALSSIIVNFRQFKSKFFFYFFKRQKTSKNIKNRHRMSKNIKGVKNYMSDASSQLTSVDVNWRQWRHKNDDLRHDEVRQLT